MGRYNGLRKGEESVYKFVENCLSKEAADVVRQHSFAAAFVAGTAGIPGGGTTACVLAQTTVVFSMYVRINKALNIKISENKLKSLASAVIGNIATNAAGYVAGILVSTVLSFVPGIGSGASMMIMASLGYATATIAGLVYSLALDSMIRSGKNIENMSESELKDALNEELDKRDISQDMKNFSAEYKKASKEEKAAGYAAID